MLRFGSIRLNQQLVVRHVTSSTNAITSNPGVYSAAVPRFPRRTSLHRPSAALVAALNHQKMLIEKHKGAVEQLDHSNLFNLTDGLEFSGNVSLPALNAVRGLMTKSPEKVNSLSDQRLAILVSAAGEKSELNVEKWRRVEYLKEIWPKLLASEGFGIECLNTYLETNLFLGETFSLTDILDILSEKKLTANAQTYEYLVAEANAQGNLQAIVEIIKEMKSNSLPLTQSTIENWVECLALKEARKDFKAVIAAFKSSLDPFRLYLSASVGLARAGKGKESVDILIDLPSAESRASNQNADLVIKLFSRLVENRVENAAEIVRPYLPEGRLEFKQQAALKGELIHLLKSETPVEMAVQIPELVKEDTPTKYGVLNASTGYLLEEYEKTLTKGLNTKHIVERLLEWTTLIRTRGLTETPLADVVQLAIQKNLQVTDLYRIFIYSEEAAGLMEDVEGHRTHIFIPLVNQVVRNLPKSQVGDQTYQDLVHLATAIVGGNFTALAGPLSEKSVPYLKSVFNAIPDRSHLPSVVIGTMLSNEQFDRLKQLMDTKIENEKEVKILRNRVVNPLMRVLKSNKFDEEYLPTISKVIAGGFNASDKATTPGGEVIASILAASTITDSRVEKLIKLLVDEPRVTIGGAEIKRIEAHLREVNLPHRASLIKYLKRKSTTYQRWQTTEDITELQRESESLEQTEEVPSGVLLTLYEVILKKAVQEKNIDAIMKTLPKFYQVEKDNQGDVKIFRNRIIEAQNMAFVENLNNEAWEAADLLWNLKPLRNPESVLLYALTLCRRKKPEEAHEVLKNLKSSAMNLHPSNFNNIASSHVLKAAEEPEIEQFLKLLTKEFNIKSTWKARLKVDVKMNRLRRLLEEKKLEEAFQLSIETSKECGYTFGSYELMNEALQAEDQPLIKKMKNLIISIEDINTFIIIFGVCLLERGDKRGVDLLKSKIEYIPSRKLTELTRREFNLKNAEIMHVLFNIFNKPENSALELEDLMRKTAELYERQNNLEGLKRLFDDAKSSSIPLNGKIRVQFESSIKKLEATPKPSEAPKEAAEAKS